MNYKFPVDAPKRKVIKTLELLGFKVIREKEHISMLRENPDGSKTPLTMPDHGKVKASTLRTICTPGQVFQGMSSLWLTGRHNNMCGIHTAFDLEDEQ